MIAIAVDDESWTLKKLCEAIETSNDISSVNSFSSCSDTLNWAQNNKFDIAFLDINMRGMGGINLANKLKIINPNCYIIFCTGYQEYAIDAFKIHADGYLLKPIDSNQIQKEISHLLNIKIQKLLTIKCFGGFEVLDSEGNIINFKRSKTKELFALLVDRNGMGITSKEICTILWDDGSEYDEKNLKYLWNLFSDLTKTLKNANAEQVLIKSNSNHSINVKLVSCDYYDYLKNRDIEVLPTQYMPQYSWAEATFANLSLL